MKDNLGDRMKGYERVYNYKLVRRTPVIIRVDGKAFHTVTKVITAEIDPTEAYGPGEMLHRVMMQTALNMCKNMQNCVLAYTQSDEISFLLRDWDKHETEQWFDGTIQKIASISASMATICFSDAWAFIFGGRPKNAMFDARAYNVPKEDVENYFIWRQKDATRNSIQMIARKHFSHKELHGKNGNQIQEMLWSEHDCNWNDYLTWKKRGAAIYRKSDEYEYEGNPLKDAEFVYRERWYMDDNMPILTEDRDYIRRHLEPKDE